MVEVGWYEAVLPNGLGQSDGAQPQVGGLELHFDGCDRHHRIFRGDVLIIFGKFG